MNATSRPVTVWIVIALTLGATAYYGWAVVHSLEILMASGQFKQSHYFQYVPGALVALYLAVAAFAVFRGYRWSLFLYQLVLVFLALQVFVYLPGLWQMIVQHGFSPAQSGGIPLSLWLTVLAPLLMLIAAVFCTVVVYRQVYSRSGPARPQEAPARPLS